MRTGVYVVCVPPDVSDEPVRWCFVDESHADAFAELHGSGAFVTWEPIGYGLDDEGLKEYAEGVGIDWGEFLAKVEASE